MKYIIILFLFISSCSTKTSKQSSSEIISSDKSEIDQNYEIQNLYDIDK